MQHLSANKTVQKFKNQSRLERTTDIVERHVYGLRYKLFNSKSHEVNTSCNYRV